MIRGNSAQIRGEEGAHFLLRVPGRRFVVFEPEAAKADPGGQLSHIEGMIGSRINGQGDQRAIRPGMYDRSQTAPASTAPRFASSIRPLRR